MWGEQEQPLKSSKSAHSSACFRLKMMPPLNSFRRFLLENDVESLCLNHHFRHKQCVVLLHSSAQRQFFFLFCSSRNSVALSTCSMITAKFVLWMDRYSSFAGASRCTHNGKCSCVMRESAYVPFGKKKLESNQLYYSPASQLTCTSDVTITRCTTQPLVPQPQEPRWSLSLTRHGHRPRASS